MKSLLLPLAFLYAVTINAQTSLSLGDIAFVSFNTDGSDSFAFVLLKEITNGTQITFTDRGWKSGQGFVLNDTDDCILENIITWTSSGTLSYGTVVSISGTTAKVNGSTNGTIQMPNTIGNNSGSPCPSLSLSHVGESLAAYQGIEPTFADQSNFITFVYNRNTFSDPNNSEDKSELPSVFTTGTDALHLTPHKDNWICDGSTIFGNDSTLRNAINNTSNWNSRNDPEYVVDPFPYSFQETLKTDTLSFGEQIKIYPNPFNNVLNIEFANLQKRLHITIYNTLSQVITKETHSNKKHLNLDYFSNSGLFFIKINDDNGNSFITKIIKE